VYQNQVFIEALFKAFSVMTPLVARIPIGLDKRNRYDYVREIKPVPTAVIYFKSYLEIMTLLEEDFNQVRTHSLTYSLTYSLTHSPTHSLMD
jgi:hypothetical protein